MSQTIPHQPMKVIHEFIPALGYFPNNPHFPLLIYSGVFNANQLAPTEIKNLLKENNWGNSWIDSIYDEHHYHSNTHEVLIVISGTAKAIYGGPQGKIFKISEGDVIIHPAGVSHKKMTASDHFACMGAYPNSRHYDMCYGKKEEHPQVDKNIKKVGLPEADPVYGKDGLIFHYWKLS